MSVSSATLERLGGGVLFDALRVAADRGKLGLALAFLDSDPPEVMFINEYPTRMLGYTQEDLAQSGLWVFAAPEEVPRLREHLGLLGRGESVPTSFETVALTKQGRRIPIQMTLSDVELDGRRATVAFFTDVSERWRAISALQESEERFRLVVEGAPDGVVILHGERIHFLNPRAAKLLGVADAEAAVGRSIQEFLHPDDAPLAAQRISALYETGQLSREPAEYRSRNAEGEEISVEISAIPIEIGGEHAILAFARDITERKAIQGRLAEAERLTALGVLSAGVAHEINNPLAYVLLNLEYLKRELPRLAENPSLLPDLMVRVRDACHGAERVATIVRDLRTFARADDSHSGPVDLRDVIEAAINIAGNTLRQRARLIRDYRDVPLVEANANRLEQVFLNLLLNAAQAMPDGNPEQNEIRIRVYGDGARAIAEVEDTGEGIPDHVLGRIFEPFFTTKPVGVGTGLGLPICRSIVTTHGGTIEVDTRLHHGSVFRVILPASPPARKAPGAAATRAAPRTGPRGRILVVDDDLSVGSTLMLVLQADHDVELAVSGEEALAHLARSRFDAVVCDLIMPGMNGVDLYKAVSAQHPGLERRMVFMTAGNLLSRTEAFLATVDNPLLEKPLDIQKVRATLQRLVSASRLGV